jgi:general secretion pathway protein C
MKWLSKLSKIKPVPLASSAVSLLLSGYFVTTGMGHLNSTPLQEVDDNPPKFEPNETPPPAAPVLSTEQVAQAVLERNIFDSTIGSIAWEDRPASIEVDDESAEGDEQIVETPLRDCAGDLRLLASIVAEQPERSFAVIRKGATASKQIQVGTELEGIKLLLLAPTHAYVRDANAPACRLPLYLSTLPQAPIPVAAAVPVGPVRKSKKPPLFNDADHAAGITEIGPDTYKVSRDMVTRGMADAAGVVRGTKFHPQTGPGGERNAGVQLQGVTDGSTLKKLGMHEGDVLRTLNGVNLSTPDGMLGAYQPLREQKKVTLSVLRDGRPKTITYQFE